MTRIACLIFLGLMACGKTNQTEGPFTLGHTLGKNTNHSLEEASGLAASERYPGCLWTHNDSGHPAELFLLDTAAKTIGTWRLTNARNRDWEDIALGPGPNGGWWIYVGDIGDNNERYDLKVIYRLPEPSLEDQASLPVADTLYVRLSGGPRDTEAMMVDPRTNNLYLVSKKEKAVTLFEVRYPFLTDTLLAEPVLTLPVTRIVAGDISRDGDEILLKSYESIYYWRRTQDETIPQALSKPPVELAYEQEPQGEAIAWSRDGSCYYTLGENAKGERSRLYRYSRKLPGAAMKP